MKANYLIRLIEEYCTEKNLDITQQLTKAEQSLLDKYNSLDYVGKHTVDTVLEMEFTRCN